MKIRNAIAVAGALGLCGLATPAIAQPKAPLPACLLYWKEGTPYRSHRHVVGGFEISCSQAPVAASGFIQLEWWNPKGGSSHKGGWETLPPMPRGWPPNRYNISVGMLPPSGDEKKYTMTGRCAVDRKIREHGVGETTEPDGTVKRFNSAHKVDGEVLCGSGTSPL